MSNIKKETIEDFLARGGKIQQIDPSPKPKSATIKCKTSGRRISTDIALLYKVTKRQQSIPENQESTPEKANKYNVDKNLIPKHLWKQLGIED